MCMEGFGKGEGKKRRSGKKKKGKVPLILSEKQVAVIGHCADR